MSLILGLGSNVGHRSSNLALARQHLRQFFKLICESQIYESSPVDDLDQGPFLNQVVEYELPSHLGPLDVLSRTQSIEKMMGRQKVRDKGPRNIDIDILFYGLESFHSPQLTLPHPQWFKRNFVLLPLMNDLPFFQRPFHRLSPDQVRQNAETHWTKIHPIEIHLNP